MWGNACVSVEAPTAPDCQAEATDAEEVLVEDARGFRNNVGPDEHGFITAFNASMVEAFAAA